MVRVRWQEIERSGERAEQEKASKRNVRNRKD